MEVGVVKWFNNAKGFGFISKEGHENIFAHFSVIEMEGYRTLKAGQKVQFKWSESEKGDYATCIIPIEEK